MTCRYRVLVRWSEPKGEWKSGQWVFYQTESALFHIEAETAREAEKAAELHVLMDHPEAKLIRALQHVTKIEGRL